MFGCKKQKPASTKKRKSWGGGNFMTEILGGFTGFKERGP